LHSDRIRRGNVVTAYDVTAIVDGERPGGDRTREVDLRYVFTVDDKSVCIA
jgi:hypothetical protein